MCTDRRDFLRLSAGVAGTALLANTVAFGADATEASDAEPFQQREVPGPIRKLKKMTDGVVPISMDERRGRIEKARRLMRENKIDAISLEPGPSMFY
ncbi:MAG TPA: twin-arginine translocation signal domain-containing protein, partial [Pyrinomonadaceae bacterium]